MYTPRNIQTLFKALKSISDNFSAAYKDAVNQLNHMFTVINNKTKILIFYCEIFSAFSAAQCSTKQVKDNSEV